ncbi:ArnT family glycosyltransferase [Phycisphaera mikurensis]|uniref:Putative glycosyltransferase n=1 Tax=Phycisphaera mikurensis (strain NBRC 102666 / KCTC 22515 / FYK2301M01) TaxID=1142394 RepID=I0IGS5_PHYMF|nr:glycosyltransferase family 39 protein [Phycisphaera mikurensis]MBB6443252.1 4-amino-4-deoxy-L-arabinose transferase-like glycosyltransferase [Phycisphaera mikurensis]BAM04463.1 putative glycosyltransferase [Phycisphaera mikurensis NBRC 102666]
MTRPAASLRGRLLVLIMVAVGCLPVLLFLGDAPLRGSSEARYARVAQLTAAEPAPAGAAPRWLVPRTDTGPHLTKPPLAYAAMAVSMRVLGETPLAARLPGALSACGVLALLGFVALRLHGPGVAAVAVGVLAITPLHVAVARVATTDAMLALASLGTLAAGLLARAAGPSRRVTLLFHGSIALGLLAKGPIALLPAGLVLGWLALPPADRAALRRLRPGVGLPLACLPLAAWAGGVAWHDPAAAELWWQETVGRVGASADHPKPWWYLLPFFALGLWPVTLLLPLAGPRRALAAAAAGARRKHPASLLAPAAAAPLLLFTLFTGKLPTYLLPCAAPLAWCVGLRFGRGEREVPASGVASLAASLALPAAAVAVLAARPGLAGADWIAYASHPALPQAAVGLGAGCVLVATLALAWRGRSRGAVPAGAAFAVVVACWGVLARTEARVLTDTATPRWVAEAAARSGLASPQVWTAGFDDPALPFVTGRPTRKVHLPLDRRRWARLVEVPRVLAATPAAWEAMRSAMPNEHRRAFEDLGRLPMRDVPPPWSGVRLFRVTPTPAAADPAPPPASPAPSAKPSGDADR